MIELTEASHSTNKYVGQGVREGLSLFSRMTWMWVQWPVYHIKEHEVRMTKSGEDRLRRNMHDRYLLIEIENGLKIWWELTLLSEFVFENEVKVIADKHRLAYCKIYCQWLLCNIQCSCYSNSITCSYGDTSINMRSYGSFAINTSRNCIMRVDFVTSVTFRHS